ncbi:MAG: cytochrome c [Methyloceanibacter sp.]|nr:cytochrome c [Methyloceanibacter sp.]
MSNELATSLDGGTGQDWKGAFQKLTDTCKSCHQDFRAKEAGQRHH